MPLSHEDNLCLLDATQALAREFEFFRIQNIKSFTNPYVFDRMFHTLAWILEITPDQLEYCPDFPLMAATELILLYDSSIVGSEVEAPPQKLKIGIEYLTESKRTLINAYASSRRAKASKQSAHLFDPIDTLSQEELNERYLIWSEQVQCIRYNVRSLSLEQNAGLIRIEEHCRKLNQLINSQNTKMLGSKLSTILNDLFRLPRRKFSTLNQQIKGIYQSGAAILKAQRDLDQRSQLRPK